MFGDDDDESGEWSEDHYKSNGRVEVVLDPHLAIEARSSAPRVD